MKVPGFKRLRTEDFTAEEQAFVDKLATPINSGFEFLYDLVAGKLSVADNLATQIKTVNVTVNSNGIPRTTTQFKLDTTDPIQGLLIINATSTSNPSLFPSGSVQIFFTQNKDIITMAKVSGLPENSEFALKILVIK